MKTFTAYKVAKEESLSEQFCCYFKCFSLAIYSDLTYHTTSPTRCIIWCRYSLLFNLALPNLHTVGIQRINAHQFLLFVLGGYMETFMSCLGHKLS